MSDWQPIYRFSRQRYAGSPGIRKRRARGRCGEPGVLPTGPRRPCGAFLAGGGCTCAVPVVVVENPHRPEPDALACCRRLTAHRLYRGVSPRLWESARHPKQGDGPRATKTTTHRVHCLGRTHRLLERVGAGTNFTGPA
jgi:hypothetical protein